MFPKVIESSLEFGNLDLFHEKGGGTQWFILKLDCGHIVGRYTAPKKEKAPKRVFCEYCENNLEIIQKNYNYTSDEKGFERYLDTGLPKKICNKGTRKFHEIWTHGTTIIA